MSYKSSSVNELETQLVRHLAISKAGVRGARPQLPATSQHIRLSRELVDRKMNTQPYVMGKNEVLIRLLLKPGNHRHRWYARSELAG